MTSTSTADRELVVSRIIDSPRSQVFQAFTAARHITQWFGPDGLKVTSHAFDFNVGGGWVFLLQAPDGTSYANFIRWREITPPERLVLEHGRYVGDAKAFDCTITLTEQSAATEIIVRVIFNTQELRDRMVQQFNAIEGGKQTLGRLAAYVADLSKKGT